MNDVALPVLPERQFRNMSDEIEVVGSLASPLTRRRFLKRAGGASVSAVVAWNLAVEKVKGQASAAGSGSAVWGMLCTDPTTTQQTTGWSAIAVPLAGGGTANIQVALTGYSSKLKDAPGTTPYNDIQFTGTIDADIANGAGVYQSTVQYNVDYDLDCERSTGAITGSYVQKPKPPAVQAFKATLGTTSITVYLLPQNPFPGGTGGHALICYTAAVLKVAWSYPASPGIPAASGIISHPTGYPFNINTVFMAQEIP